MSDDAAVIHIDGASRGNPGDAAYAVVIAVPGRPPIEESGVLGQETNNVAEYTALIKALEKARHLGLRRLAIHSDSELVVKQVKGEYKIKNDDLKWLADEAKTLMKEFVSVSLTHVRREQNKRADELCNIALDAAKPKKPTPAAASEGRKEAGRDGDRRPGSGGRPRMPAVGRAVWSRGESVPSPELVWDQLWSILEEGGVLKKK